MSGAEQKKFGSSGLGAVTDSELIAAPGAGFRIVIDSYEISVGTAAAIVTLEQGTAVIIQEFRFGVNGGTNAPHTRIPLGANLSLTITTSASGPTSVFGFAHVESA